MSNTVACETLDAMCAWLPRSEVGYLSGAYFRVFGDGHTAGYAVPLPGGSVRFATAFELV